MEARVHFTTPPSADTKAGVDYFSFKRQSAERVSIFYCKGFWLSRKFLRFFVGFLRNAAFWAPRGILLQGWRYPGSRLRGTSFAEMTTLAVIDGGLGGCYAVSAGALGFVEGSIGSL